MYPPLVGVGPLAPQPIAKLFVESYVDKNNAKKLECKIGEQGKPFIFNFIDFINLIQARAGRGQLRLDYKR